MWLGGAGDALVRGRRSGTRLVRLGAATLPDAHPIAGRGDADHGHYLFQLLPHFDSLDMLENNLSDLLANSSSLPEYQEKLALRLAQRYRTLGKHTDAMHCFAKTLQIKRSKDNY